MSCLLCKQIISVFFSYLLLKTRSNISLISPGESVVNVGWWVTGAMVPLGILSTRVMGGGSPRATNLSGSMDLRRTERGREMERAGEEDQGEERRGTESWGRGVEVRTSKRH